MPRTSWLALSGTRLCGTRLCGTRLCGTRLCSRWFALTDLPCVLVILLDLRYVVPTYIRYIARRLADCEEIISTSPMSQPRLPGTSRVSKLLCAAQKLSLRLLQYTHLTILLSVLSNIRPTVLDRCHQFVRTSVLLRYRTLSQRRHDVVLDGLQINRRECSCP